MVVTISARLLHRVVVAFLLGKSAVLLANVCWFPTLTKRTARAGVERDGAPPDEMRPLRTALLIPMRNEAETVVRTLPGFVSGGFDEIVFLDDESDDGSAATVQAFIDASDASVPPMRLVSGAPRPPGWVGKTWACAQLAAEVGTADILVFCDADVLLAAGVAQNLVREMRRQSATVFSVFCRQLTGSWSERLLTPLITDVVLCFLPFGLLSAPVPSAATASGALLLFQRSAYGRLGGFAAVSEELVEDLAIARRARRMGEKLGLALGGDQAQVRMYDGYRSVIHGMGRSLGPAVGGRRTLLAAGWAWHVLAYTLPVLLARSPRWRMAAALGVVERLLLEAKTGGHDWVSAALIGLSPLAAGPVVVQALRRRQSWKGRVYG